jgi:hypothetical protein
MSEHQDDRNWWLWNAPTLPWRLWPLIRDRRATVGEVLRHLFGDDEAVKFALASNLAYYADDPETCHSYPMPFRKRHTCSAAVTTSAAARRSLAIGWSQSYRKLAVKPKPNAKQKPSCSTTTGCEACAIARAAEAT